MGATAPVDMSTFLTLRVEYASGDGGPISMQPVEETPFTTINISAQHYGIFSRA